ncbi:MAG: Ig-like domain-containing protein, partial [Planctomycetaceae bacterium]
MRLSNWWDSWVQRIALHSQSRLTTIQHSSSRARRERGRRRPLQHSQALEVRTLLSNLVVVNDTFTLINSGTAHSLDVLANDVDTQGGVVRLNSVSSPTRGSAIIVPGTAGQRDRLQYTPIVGFVGSDSFTYSARAVDNVVRSATITITLQASSGGSSGGGAAATPPTLTNLRLSNDTGVANDNITSDPRVTGTVVSTGGLTGLGVQFDFDGNATVDASTTQVNPDGTFTFDPAKPGANATGIAFGTYTLKARPTRTVAGQTLIGSWQNLTFTYQSPPPVTPTISGLKLVNDTRFPADKITSDARVTGVVAFNGSLSGLTVHIDTDGNGTSDLTTSTGVDGTFQVDVAQVNATGPGIGYGPANLRFRSLSGDHVGAWSEFSFTYEAPPVRPSVTGLKLVNDTGDSTDRITTDPRITASLSNSDGGLLGLTVQVDYNDDGIAEGTESTDAYGRFEFNPAVAQGQTPPLAFGQRALKVRGGEFDSFTNRIEFGSWISLAFEYLAAPTPSQIGNLHLANDTGTSGDKITSNPTIVGNLTNLNGATGLVIEYDYNGDGVAEVAAAPNSDGSFLLNPGVEQGSTAPVSYGDVTIHVRAGKNQTETTEKLYGDWSSLSFTYSASAPGVAPNANLWIDQLRLLNDTGNTADFLTEDPRLTGYALGAGNLGELTFEFDLGGDGTIDGTVAGSIVGTFEIDPRPMGVVPGSIQAFVRATRVLPTGTVDRSDWKLLRSTYAPAPAAQIENLQLVNDTGLPGDSVTSVAKVAGVVTLSGAPLGGVAVQFALDEPDQPKGTVYTANNGTFTIDLDLVGNLPVGRKLMFVRGLTVSEASDDIVVGDWARFEFTYDLGEVRAPVIEELRLVRDTGLPGDLATADPRVSGRLSNPGGSLASLPVQIDFDGDELPEGLVRTDSAGRFAFDPREAALPEGTVPLRVRSLVFDEIHLRYVLGSWTTLSFQYTWEAPVPPTIQS